MWIGYWLGWLKILSESEFRITFYSIQDDVCRILKDGRVLCKVMNALYPGSIKKINKIDNPNSPFKKTKETENIANFLKYCVEKAGCVVGKIFW